MENSTYLNCCLRKRLTDIHKKAQKTAEEDVHSWSEDRLNMEVMKAILIDKGLTAIMERLVATHAALEKEAAILAEVLEKIDEMS